MLSASAWGQLSVLIPITITISPSPSHLMCRNRSLHFRKTAFLQFSEAFAVLSGHAIFAISNGLQFRYNSMRNTAMSMHSQSWILCQCRTSATALSAAAWRHLSPLNPNTFITSPMYLSPSSSVPSHLHPFLQLFWPQPTFSGYGQTV